MKKILYTSLFSILLACGSGTSSEQPNDAAKDSNIVENEIIEISVAAIGESMAEIAFDPTSLSIPANSTVKLTFTNKSSTKGMLHNFVLVKLGTGSKVASAGISAGKAQEFVPKSNDVLVFTAIADLGETIEIEFEAPAKGSYHYICTYPGHTNMIGRLNVI